MNVLVGTIVLLVMLFSANAASALHDVTRISLYGIKLAMTPEEVTKPLQELFPGNRMDLREKEGEAGAVEYETHLSEPGKEIWLTFDRHKRLIWLEYIMKYKKGLSAAESELAIKDTVERYGPYDDTCSQKSMYGDTSIEMVWGSKFKKETAMGFVVHMPDFNAGPVFLIKFSLEDSKNPSVSFNLIARSETKEVAKQAAENAPRQDETPVVQRQQSQDDEKSVKACVSSYYEAIQDKQVDRAMNMYATEARPRIIRKRIEAVATDTEYYRIDDVEVSHLSGNKAVTLVKLRHKKYGLNEERWEINITLIKENSEWKISSTPGKRLTEKESEQRSQEPDDGQAKPSKIPQRIDRYAAPEEQKQLGEAENNSGVRVFSGSAPWGDTIIRVDNTVFRHFNIDDIKTKLDPGYSNYRYSNPYMGGTGQWHRTGGMGSKYMLAIYFRGASKGTMSVEFYKITAMGKRNPVHAFMKEAFYEGIGDMKAAGFVAGEPWNEAIVHWVPAKSAK